MRELVDNAWDADADNVWISVPQADLPNMTDAGGRIEVRDDGTGMTQEEVRTSYLLVARGRISKGEFTVDKRRAVKGRKGIGKFAGLVMANQMRVETVARGKRTELDVTKADVLVSATDLEEVELPLRSFPDEKSASGTTVGLTELSQALRFPYPQKLRELLALDYGQEDGFSIFVNGEKLMHEDLPGESNSVEENLPAGGEARMKFTIMDKPKARKAGIIIRVGGKAVGCPTFLGLDKEDDIPQKALKRIVGEIEVASEALQDAVTADWGGFVENNVAYEEISSWAADQVRAEVGRVFAKEVNLAKARRQRQINLRLAKLPEHRRHFAQRELDQIFNKYWADSDDRIDTMIALVFDAFEKDEYFFVCQEIEEASHADIAKLAEALNDFGLMDMAILGQQARRRLQYLDYLDDLVADEETLESTVHKAIETNLWVFGPQYSMISSNKTLKQVVADYLDRAFAGDRARKRPDLFLGQDVHEAKLLIEFKRPSDSVGRNAEAQAKKYRDDLTPKFGHMSIMIVGGRVDRGMSSQYQDEKVAFTSYSNVISRSRSQFEWLLRELQE